MSYAIYIGNAIPVYPSKENGYIFSWEVEQIEKQDAPEWKYNGEYGHDVSGKTNGRHPGCVQMSEFCEEAGVSGLFFKDDDCLIASNPGITHITDFHARKITFARQKWEEKNPGSIPGWNEGEDPILSRLIWYEWWIKWALSECEHPAIENF